MQPRSARLNANNRDKFIRAVLDDKLPETKKESIDDFKERWKSKIYDVCFEPYKDLLAQMPEWMKIETDVVRVGLLVKGKLQKVPFPMDRKHLIPFGVHHSGYYYSNENVVLIDENHTIHKEYAQILQDEEDYLTKKRELRNQLHKLAYSCNTSGQLYKAWPEAVKYSGCFPYKAPNKHTGAAVTATEMDLGLLMSETKVAIPKDE